MTAGAEPLLAGGLAGFALADVLQLLELGGRTGVLEIDGGAFGAARVVVRRGRVALIDGPAVGGAAEPGEAVGRLLDLPSGRWTFRASTADVDGPEAGDPDAGVPIGALLVDAARRRDEGARAAAPPGDDDVPRPAPPDAPDTASGPGACLTAFHLRVLSAVDGVRSVRALAAALRADPARVHAAAAELRALGLIAAA